MSLIANQTKYGQIKKSSLHDNDIEMQSTHYEGKPTVAK